MKRDWERCPRGDAAGRWAAPYVTMNAGGKIVISRHTHERMSEPEAYMLLFDRQNNTIGLDPAARATPDAYPAAPNGRHGGRQIRAYRLLRRFDIPISDTIRFRPEIDDDGVLILDLRTAVPVRRRRQ